MMRDILMRMCGPLMAALSLAHLSAAQAAETEKLQKVTYQQHVRPILREHCFVCHNQNEARGGLSLDSYPGALEGGSSGEVVLAGDLASSRLWALVTHTDEPSMPPMQDKLPQEELDVIRLWIEGGALENSSSKANVQKKASLELVTTAGTRPEGPAAMPHGLWREPVVYTQRAAAVSAIATSPWAPVAAVAGQQQIVLYHTDTGACLGVLPFPEGVPYVLTFSRNGALLLAGGGHGGHSGCAVLYDVQTGRRLLRVGDELDVVLAADINDTHTRIALAGPQRIVRIFSTESGELLHEIKKHTDWVYAVRFSPDGVLLATADRSNGLFVWEAQTAREYLNLQGHSGPIRALSWRPDSNVLASASEDGTIRLWEMVDGKQVKSWNAHAAGALAVHYAHNGRLVTAGRDKRVKVWDGDGKLIKAMPALEEPALEAAFTHDGQRVLGGDWLGQVRLWTIQDAQPVATLPPNPPTLAMLAQREAERAAIAQQAAQQAAEELAEAQAAADQRQGATQAPLASKKAAAEAAQAEAHAAHQAAKRAADELAAFQQAHSNLAHAVERTLSRLLDAQSQFEHQQRQRQAAQRRYDELLAAQKKAEQDLAARRHALKQAQEALTAAHEAAEQAAAARDAFRQAYRPK